MPSSDQTITSQDIFDLTTQSIPVDSLVAYTSECYLGRVTDPETNSTTTADFMAQFATLEGDDLPSIDAMYTEDGKAVADSIVLNLYIKSYYGDSLNSIKIGVYELDPDNILPEDKDYYTNIDPEEYVNKNDDAIRKEVTFAVTDLSIEDTVRNASSYSKNIRITLDPDYGTRILQAYYDHPEYFKDSYQFIRHVMPGFYFKTLAGNGTMVNIDVSTITVFYRFSTEDSTYVGIKRVAATNEVIQCNTFENRNLQPLLEATDYTYIKSPAAIFTEVTLPVNEIYEDHENDSINSAKIGFTRHNNDLTSDYTLPVPSTLLLISKDKLVDFFEDRETPDYITSYVSSFSSSYNSYTFSNISSALSYLHQLRNNGAGITDGDSNETIKLKTAAWEANNPDWNKMVLVPVTTSTSSSSIVSIYHDFSLASTKLEVTPQISVIYSRFQ